MQFIGIETRSSVSPVLFQACVLSTHYTVLTIFPEAHPCKVLWKADAVVTMHLVDHWSRWKTLAMYCWCTSGKCRSQPICAVGWALLVVCIPYQYQLLSCVYLLMHLMPMQFWHPIWYLPALLHNVLLIKIIVRRRMNISVCNKNTQATVDLVYNMLYWFMNTSRKKIIKFQILYPVRGKADSMIYHNISLTFVGL